MSLKNSYYIIRHGESEANRAGLIVSSPQNGVTAFGLTEKGKNMVHQSVSRFSFSSPVTRIVTSDFKRAIETARIAAETLNIGAPDVNFLLRERFFGDLEKKGDRFYPQVWKDDRENPDNTDQGVESPRAVARRVEKLFTDLETAYRDETILLVSHGDILQIMLTIAAGSEPHRHRDIEHISPAELRPLTAAPSFITKIKESS